MSQRQKVTGIAACAAPLAPEQCARGSLENVNRYTRRFRDDPSPTYPPHSALGIRSSNNQWFNDGKLIVEQLDKADRLFTAELAWLCEYATELREMVNTVHAHAVNFEVSFDSLKYRSRHE